MLVDLVCRLTKLYKFCVNILLINKIFANRNQRMYIFDHPLEYSCRHFRFIFIYFFINF